MNNIKNVWIGMDFKESEMYYFKYMHIQTVCIILLFCESKKYNHVYFDNYRSIIFRCYHKFVPQYLLLIQIIA